MTKEFKEKGYGWVYVKKKKTKAGVPGIWPETKRLEVVTTYLSTGNYRLTGAITGIPHQTLMAWRRTDWWKELVEQIQESEDMELSNKLKKVVDRSLEVVADRLENGDFMYDPKTGKMIRVPVKLRDTHRVMTDLVDKRMLLQKRPTKITEHQTTVDDRLKNLATQFAQFVTGKVAEVQNDNIPLKEVYEGDKVLEGEFITEVKEE